jgi:FtsZ-binding cell division protein ZapB
MFKTHDNKLSEHELSIGDCFEQLKEIDERLVAVESSNGNSGGDVEVAGSGDLNELMNDGAFINGIVDNIMNTTNFASIVENVIPLKEENEALKQEVQVLNEQVHGLREQVQGLDEQIKSWKDKMQQLEDQVRSLCSSGASAVTAAHFSSETAAASEVGEAVPSDEKCMDGEECEEQEEES